MNITEPDWMRLEPTIWKEVFLYLDIDSLLSASVTCKNFRDIFSSYSQILKKVKIPLRFPEIDGNGQIDEITNRLKNHAELTRRYQILEITLLSDRILCEDEENRSRGRNSLRTCLMSTCNKLAQSVQTLTLQNCCILQKDVTEVLLPFVHVCDLKLIDIVLCDETTRTRVENFHISFPNLRTLSLQRCDFFCLILFKSQLLSWLIRLTFEPTLKNLKTSC